MNPVFVDLDGTLLFSDSSQEVFLRLLLKQPWHALTILYLLIIKGIVAAKVFMATKIVLNDTVWPFNPAILHLLKVKKAEGRKIILLTASQEDIAQKIVSPLGLFDQIIGTHAAKNFKGKEKLAWIQREFSLQKFEYLGNSKDDYILWQHAENPIVVNPNQRVLKKAKKLLSSYQIIQNKPSKLQIFLQLLRVHQYSKNLLVFLPILLSGKWSNLSLLINSALAFIAFSFITSIGYILNDFIDLDHDRIHATKKTRPLAAGHINIASALACMFILLAAMLLVCHWLPALFVLAIAAYFALTFLYSFFLKKLVIIDVFVLSALYIMRIVAGSAATGIIISQWLFIFALFFFLSLGYLKRFIEINHLQPNEKAKGRNYYYQDRVLVKISGISLGFISVMIFALYINSDVIKKIYATSLGLWVIVILLVYWLNYIWHAAVHNKVHEDPIKFALNDRISQILGIMCVAIVLICQR